jgi:transposase
MVVVDGEGVPIGGSLASASPAEVTLLEDTIATIAVPRKGRGRPRKNPRRIVADKGYDSDPLRDRLKRRGIELIAPYRKSNRRWKHYDGRKMRRYKRRWKVERTFAWLQNFRRLIVRHERLITTYRAFFHVACLIIALRQL